MANLPEPVKDSSYFGQLQGLDFSCKKSKYTWQGYESTTGATPEEATDATHAGATPEEATDATLAGATPEATNAKHEEATEAATPEATKATTHEEATKATEATEATEATKATEAATHEEATTAATHAGATPEEITEATNKVLDEGVYSHDDVLATTKGVTTEHTKDKKKCTESIKALKEHQHLLGDFSEFLNEFEDEILEPPKEDEAPAPGSLIKDFLMDTTYRYVPPEECQPEGTVNSRPSPRTPDMEPSGTVMSTPAPPTPNMQPSGTVISTPAPPTPDMQPSGTVNSTPVPQTPTMQPNGTVSTKPSPQTPEMVSNGKTYNRSSSKSRDASDASDDSDDSDDSDSSSSSSEVHGGLIFKEKGEVRKHMRPVIAQVWHIHKKKKRKTDDDSDSETQPFKLVPWQCMLCFNFVNCVLFFHELFA